MNSIQEINRINQRELDLGLSGNASWHHQYKDSAYVHVGGLSYDMTEGDVIAVFSQFGEIMDINMPRDKETGKARGFAFLMFEDQRSTILAVDNMNGAQVLGRIMKVDHVHKYEQPGKRDEDGKYQKPEEPTYNAMPPEFSGSDYSSDSDSDAGADGIDADDPMAEYLKKKKKIKGGGGREKEEKQRRKEERARKREERDRRRRDRDREGRDKGKGKEVNREREDSRREEGAGSSRISKLRVVEGRDGPGAIERAGVRSKGGGADLRAGERDDSRNRSESRSRSRSPRRDIPRRDRPNRSPSPPRRRFEDSVRDERNFRSRSSVSNGKGHADRRDIRDGRDQRSGDARDVRDRRYDERNGDRYGDERHRDRNGDGDRGRNRDDRYERR